MRGGHLWSVGVGRIALAVAVAVTLVACGGTSGENPGLSGAGASGASDGSLASGALASAGPASASASPVGSGQSGGGASAGPSASAGSTARPVATVKGTGFVDSKTFNLKSGNYLVRWTITSKDAAGCHVIGAIHTPDGLTSVEVANTSFAGTGSKSGQKAVSRLAPGSYVVTFATTCTWTAKVYAN